MWAWLKMYGRMVPQVMWLSRRNRPMIDPCDYQVFDKMSKETLEKQEVKELEKGAKMSGKQKEKSLGKRNEWASLWVTQWWDASVGLSLYSFSPLLVCAAIYLFLHSPVHMPIIHHCTYPTFHLFIHLLFICSSHLFVHLLLFLSHCQSIHCLSIHTPLCLSIHPGICSISINHLSIHLFICHCIFPILHPSVHIMSVKSSIYYLSIHSPSSLPSPPVHYCVCISIQ